MKKYYKQIILFLALLPGSLYAQEIISGLRSNAAIKKYREQHPANTFRKAKSISDTVALPFFDDFAKPAIFPDPNLWADENAYINTGFNGYSTITLSENSEITLLDTTPASNPPTIGIATLDAIDRNGLIYSSLLPGLKSPADTMTSNPVYLHYLPGDSVYLSFEYQPSNVGNTPETGDSLVLEFFSPVDTVQPWRHIWSALGATDKTYRKVMISITDTNYLRDGFQFRFRNYVSLGSDYEPSWLSNCDQWNIDMVYLNTGRQKNEPPIEDVAVLYPIKSILKYSLESMPWKHFQSAGNSILTSSLKMIARNTGASTTWAIHHICKIYDLFGNTPVYKSDSVYNNVGPNKFIFLGKNFSYPFTSSSGDSASFLIKTYMNLGSLLALPWLKPNDTTYYYQNFSNYYSYDDGSAENGYGVSGSGTQNARMALKYKCYKQDTLKGVYIFFNSTLDDYTEDKYFYLTAWEDAGGVPGAELISQIGEHPSFDGLNKFHYYGFESPVVIESGATFYIGMVKTTNDNLNIGLDRNRDAHEHLFYNISGSWIPSEYSGALMIRPAFGSAPVIKKTTSVQVPLDFYPNPSSDKINIQYPQDISPENVLIHLDDLYGKTVVSTGYKNVVDISALPPGVYVISVTDQNKYFFTKKIIITR